MTCTDIQTQPEPRKSSDLSESRKAFDEALEEEIPNLRRYALSLTRDSVQAEELVQDCAVRALRKRHQFCPGTHMRRWLFTILRNLHLDSRRRHARRGPHVEFEDWHSEPFRRPPQEDWMELVDVQRSIKMLRPCDRKVLLLSALSQMSQKDIARQMGIAEGTVRSRLSRARAALSD